MKTEATLFLIGCIFIVVGIFIVLLSKIPILSRLPGNILVERRNFVFHFPLGFCIFASIILTLILNLFFARK